MDAIEIHVPDNFDRFNQFFKSFDNFGFYRLNNDKVREDEAFKLIADHVGDDIFKDEIHALIYGYGKENNLILYLTNKGIIPVHSHECSAPDEETEKNIKNMKARVKEFLLVKYGYDIDQIIKDHEESMSSSEES